mmetsp:Transcript_26949/g.40215  ORF Transcript_26949/g.40215 Transcript_26949/m.40215 type:complete len:82 (-) Transcript_26949:65-310(-)
MSGREAEVMAQLNQAVTQLLQNQVSKTCFNMCFQNGNFPNQMGRVEKVCLAKCMDRMFEAHAIVLQASVEMAQALSQDGRN